MTFGGVRYQQGRGFAGRRYQAGSGGIYRGRRYQRGTGVFSSLAKAVVPGIKRLVKTGAKKVFSHGKKLAVKGAKRAFVHAKRQGKKAGLKMLHQGKKAGVRMLRQGTQRLTAAAKSGVADMSNRALKYATENSNSIAKSLAGKTIASTLRAMTGKLTQANRPALKQAVGKPSQVLKRRRQRVQGEISSARAVPWAATKRRLRRRKGRRRQNIFY